MSTTAPRFAKKAPRGFAYEFNDPIAPSLAALLPERSEQHRRVARRLAELQARRVELARQLAEQEEADRQAAARAALERKSAGRRQKAASLRRKLEDADGEAEGFEAALARSADNLLEAAAPLAARAAEKANKAHAAALARARELLAALDTTLEEAANLTGEQLWIARLDGPGRIEPFRPIAADAGIGRLRRALADAFAEWQLKAEEHRAEAERVAAWEREHEAEWARKEEQARRDDAESRVIYEGMKLVSKGGRSVGPGGFQAPEEEPRP
jgi:hypothetical protein